MEMPVTELLVFDPVVVVKSETPVAPVNVV
jgi:hypothetical protein